MTTTAKQEKIEGIKVEQDQGLMVVFIDKFSKDLQELVRAQLTSIFNGFAEVQESPQFHSYSNTLHSFFNRYDTKSEDIKKGMIGELLAHILINALFRKLTCLSILKNKEERSIKKGFDIIYFHETTKDIWYTEVKSGKNSTTSSDEYNLELLRRAKDGIIKMLKSKRSTLWENALIDVRLVIEDKNRRVKMKDLLSKDAPTKGNKKATGKKNVILVSVLYHTMRDKMTLNKVMGYYRKVLGEKLFNNAVVFSIQKETYSRVAKFLRSEIKKT